MISRWIFATLLFLSPFSLAKAANFTLTPQAGWLSPKRFSLGIDGSYELVQGISLYVGLQTNKSTQAAVWKEQALVGVELAWDAYRWVPSLSMALGPLLQGSNAYLGWATLAHLYYFLHPHTGAVLAGGIQGEFDKIYGAATLGWFWQF